MSHLKNTTLLLLGHGSSTHPESSRSCRTHTELLRQRKLFSEVHCAFLKEKPYITDALEKIHTEKIIIVPDFLAEGYFTQQIIPKLLKLNTQPETTKYCRPIGTHPAIQDLILETANNTLGSWQPQHTTLLLIGHGSNKNNNSKQTLLEHAQALRTKTNYAEIIDLWIEEAPRVENWRDLTTQQQAIAVPYLLSDGLHGSKDIPELLHLINLENTPKLRITKALGNSPKFANIIEQIATHAT